MSEVEQLAQEQFSTFRNRLYEMISEIAEEHRSAFMQGYAKGETDEKFRTKQELEKENEELKEELKNLSSVAEVRLANWQKYEKENEELINKIENLQKYLDTQNSYRECAETWKKLTYAKTIIQDLLNNSDEYARQRAIDFLKENE